MTVKRLIEILEAFGQDAKTAEVMVWLPSEVIDIGGDWAPAQMVTHEQDGRIYINARAEF